MSFEVTDVKAKVKAGDSQDMNAWEEPPSVESNDVVQLVTPGSKWSRNYENELVCEVCGMTMMQRDSPGRTAHNLRVHAGSRHGIRDSEVYIDGVLLVYEKKRKSDTGKAAKKSGLRKQKNARHVAPSAVGSVKAENVEESEKVFKNVAEDGMVAASASIKEETAEEVGVMAEEAQTEPEKVEKSDDGFSSEDGDDSFEEFQVMGAD